MPDCPGAAPAPRTGRRPGAAAPATSGDRPRVSAPQAASSNTNSRAKRDSCSAAARTQQRGQRRRGHYADQREGFAAGGDARALVAIGRELRAPGLVADRRHGKAEIHQRQAGEQPQRECTFASAGGLNRPSIPAASSGSAASTKRLRPGARSDRYRAGDPAGRRAGAPRGGCRPPARGSCPARRRRTWAGAHTAAARPWRGAGRTGRRRTAGPGRGVRPLHRSDQRAAQAGFGGALVEPDGEECARKRAVGDRTRRLAVEIELRPLARQVHATSSSSASRPGICAASRLPRPRICPRSRSACRAIA